ncbi:MAG: hypothetical protein JXL67_06170 [Calditrichaeota bacterium]|nr:hypothetical protein [Calditrichota bacterium]
MATLSAQSYDEAGKDLTLSAAAAGGDEFANTGEELLIIQNGDTSAKTVTVTAQVTSFENNEMGNAVKQNQSLEIAANNGIGIMGPFSRRAFNDSGGKVQITYSAVTNLEVAVVKES